MLMVLLIVVTSRLIVMFLNSSHIQILPEKIFAMDMVGRDWLDGVMTPVMRLWKGLPFNIQIGYGQGFTVFIGILFYPFYKSGINTQEALVNFSQISYIYVASFVLLTYVVLILTKYKKDIRNILIIVYITFLLGFSGSLGLERGNIDIIFSLVILLLYLFRLSKYSSSKYFGFIEACILGMLTASKITLLPISLAFILTSTRLWSSIIYFIFLYSAWSLSPTVFGIHSTLLDSYSAAIKFQNLYFPNTLLTGCRGDNYGLFGLASLFIPCGPSGLNIFNRLFLAMAYLIYACLFVIVFIIPLIPLVSQLQIVNRKIFFHIKFLYQNRSIFLLLLFVLAVAAINLLPNFSYSYRLYFSFSVLLAAWYSITNAKAKRLLIISTICLLLKGVWFTDWKLFNIFVVLHYVSLLYAASIELTEPLVRRKELYDRKNK